MFEKIKNAASSFVANNAATSVTAPVIVAEAPADFVASEAPELAAETVVVAAEKKPRKNAKQPVEIVCEVTLPAVGQEVAVTCGEEVTQASVAAVELSKHWAVLTLQEGEISYNIRHSTSGRGKWAICEVKESTGRVGNLARVGLSF